MRPAARSRGDRSRRQVRERIDLAAALSAAGAEGFLPSRGCSSADRATYGCSSRVLEGSSTSIAGCDSSTALWTASRGRTGRRGSPTGHSLPMTDCSSSTRRGPDRSARSVRRTASDRRSRRWGRWFALPRSRRGGPAIGSRRGGEASDPAPGRGDGCGTRTRAGPRPEVSGCSWLAVGSSAWPTGSWQDRPLADRWAPSGGCLALASRSRAWRPRGSPRSAMAQGGARLSITERVKEIRLPADSLRIDLPGRWIRPGSLVALCNAEHAPQRTRLRARADGRSPAVSVASGFGSDFDPLRGRSGERRTGSSRYRRASMPVRSHRPLFRRGRARESRSFARPSQSVREQDREPRSRFRAGPDRTPEPGCRAVGRDRSRRQGSRSPLRSRHSARPRRPNDGTLRSSIECCWRWRDLRPG